MKVNWFPSELVNTALDLKSPLSLYNNVRNNCMFSHAAGALYLIWPKAQLSPQTMNSRHHYATDPVIIIRFHLPLVQVSQMKIVVGGRLGIG